MAFTDLPAHWADRPIHHPALVADVLDLLVSLADRRAGALLLALCDAQGRLLQPCIVEGDPVGAEASRGLAFFTEVLAGLSPGGSILVAIARPTGLSATDDDRALAAASQTACADHGLRLLGVHVVTLDGSRPVPRLSEEAA